MRTNVNLLFYLKKRSAYKNGPVKVPPFMKNSLGRYSRYCGTSVIIHRPGGFINLGAAYPDSPLTPVVRGGTKSLASQIHNKTITVTGKLIDYKGKPKF